MDPQEIQQRFGARVRELRLARGLSQEQLALDAKMDRTYVNSVEHGRRNVSLVNIVRLAQSLKVEPGELFTPPKRSKSK